MNEIKCFSFVSLCKIAGFTDLVHKNCAQRCAFHVLPSPICNLIGAVGENPGGNKSWLLLLVGVEYTL